MCQLFQATPAYHRLFANSMFFCGSKCDVVRRLDLIGGRSKRLLEIMKPDDRQFSSNDLGSFQTILLAAEPIIEMFGTHESAGVQRFTKRQWIVIPSAGRPHLTCQCHNYQRMLAVF